MEENDGRHKMDLVVIYTQECWSTMPHHRRKFCDPMSSGNYIAIFATRTTFHPPTRTKTMWVK